MRSLLILALVIVVAQSQNGVVKLEQNTTTYPRLAPGSSCSFQYKGWPVYAQCNLVLQLAKVKDAVSEMNLAFRVAATGPSGKVIVSFGISAEPFKNSAVKSVTKTVENFLNPFLNNRDLGSLLGEKLNVNLTNTINLGEVSFVYPGSFPILKEILVMPVPEMYGNRSFCLTEFHTMAEKMNGFKLSVNETEIFDLITDTLGGDVCLNIREFDLTLQRIQLGLSLNATVLNKKSFSLSRLFKLVRQTVGDKCDLKCNLGFVAAETASQGLPMLMPNNPVTFQVELGKYIGGAMNGTALSKHVSVEDNGMIAMKLEKGKNLNDDGAAATQQISLFTIIICMLFLML